MNALEKTAKDFQSDFLSHREIVEPLFAELVLSGEITDSIVFQYLEGLSFPMTLHFLEPPVPLDQKGFRLDRCPGVQIGNPIPARPLAGNITVCMVESMLAFLQARQMHKSVYVAAIAADGRGAAFRSLGGDDIRAWPLLAGDNLPHSQAGAA